MRLLISSLFLIACADDARETTDVIADTTTDVIADTTTDVIADTIDETSFVDTTPIADTIVCTTPPVAHCRNLAIDLTASESALDPNALDDGSTANCGGVLTFTVAEPTLTCDDVGAHVVTLTVHEGSNVATCSATITIRDTGLPTIECRGDAIDLGVVHGSVDVPITDLYVSTSDNCSASLTFVDDTIVYRCDGLGATNSEANFDALDDAGNRSNFCHNGGIFLRCALEGDLVDVFVNDVGSVTRRADVAVAITQLQSNGYVVPNAVPISGQGHYDVVPPGSPYQPVLLMVYPTDSLPEGFVRLVGPVLDRRRVVLGRPDVTTAFANTELQVSATGMEPYVVGGRLALVSLSAGTSVYSDAGLTPGATSVDLTIVVAGHHRIDGGQGDVAWLVQHATVADTPAGVMATTLARAALLPSDFASPGFPSEVSVSAALSVPERDGVVDLDLDLAAFHALVPDGATELSVIARHSVVLTDLPIAEGEAPDFAVVSFASDVDRYTGTLAFADPFPSLPRGTTLTIGYRWLVDGRVVSGEVSARQVAAGTLGPDVAPPTAVTFVNGRLTWQGDAPLFDVTLYRLDPDLAPIATFETPLENLVPWPGMLTTGRYVARVTARSEAGRASAISPVLVIP